jgi:hypothetical protein
MVKEILRDTETRGNTAAFSAEVRIWYSRDWDG